MKKSNFARAIFCLMWLPVTFLWAQSMNMDTLDLQRNPPVPKVARGNALLLCIEPLFEQKEKRAPICNIFTDGMYEMDSDSDMDATGGRYAHTVKSKFSTLKGQPETWEMSFSTRELKTTLNAGVHTATVQFAGNVRAVFNISGRDGEGHYIHCFKGTGEMKILEADYAQLQNSWQIKPQSFAAEFTQSCLNTDNSRPSIKIHGALFYNAILPTKVDPPKNIGERWKIQFGEVVATKEINQTGEEKPKAPGRATGNTAPKRKAFNKP